MRLVALGYSFPRFDDDGKVGMRLPPLTASQAAAGIVVYGKGRSTDRDRAGVPLAPVEPGRPKPDKTAMTGPAPRPTTSI
jgi:hypothetical protein